MCGRSLALATRRCHQRWAHNERPQQNLMKIIFAGTPDFAATALAALYQAGHKISLVLTQPDRPSGRGMKLTATPVAKLAMEIGLRIEKPATLKTESARGLVAETDADVMVVAAYGLLLPKAILDLPKLGCINIHGSLLPRWRGAAPVQRAIEAGDARTGICIMQMDAGLETGSILLERAIDIAKHDTGGSLMDKLAAIGAESIVEAIARIGDLTPQPQDSAGVTYAAKITKIEAEIDWSETAEQVERRIRAFDPFPGCETTINGERLRIWGGVATDGEVAAQAGSVIAVTRDDFSVQCGRGALRINWVQRAGGRRIPARELLQSIAVIQGQQCKKL